MQIEYDEVKNQKNIELRGLPFSMVNEFDFKRAIFQNETRITYETRIISTSMIEDEFYTLVFTMRGDALRVISLRRANKKEKDKWFASQTPI